MAEKKEQPKVDFLHEKVEVFLRKNSENFKEDYFIAVNGKTFMIQRGKPVMVPRYVSLQIDENERQDLYAAQLIEQYKSEFSKV